MKNDGVVYRALELRSIDEETRTIEFVASTETPVDTWSWARGKVVKEVLRADGIDLSEYNGTVVDSHDRSSIFKIFGDAQVRVENAQVIARLRFHDITEDAKHAWEMTRSRFVKAISVGFKRKEVRQLKEGEFDGEGTRRVEGPADVVTKWSLVELSLCPVGADPNALQRALIDGNGEADEFRNLIEEVVKKTIEENNKQRGEQIMADKDKEDKEEARAVTVPVTLEATAERSEIVKREEERRDLILAIASTNTGLRALAEKCVIEGKTVEEARAILLTAHAEICKPVGTPEPAVITKTGSRTALSGDATVQKRAEDMTEDEFKKAINLS